MLIDNRTILLDTEAGYFFGEDHAYVDYPIRFPTVCIYLRDTLELCRAADTVRKAEGKLPMFDTSGEYDTEGWYDFNVCLNTFMKYHVDTCITFTVCNGQDDDDEQTYTIDMSEDEQKALWGVLNMECMETYGVGCKELLEAARAEIEE